MARENTRPMIVTFAKKDQRSNRDIDKQQILQQHVKTRFDFCNVLAMQDMQNVQGYFEELPQGLDVNLYDLPILTGSFTEDEIQSLRSDGNVARVEEDRMAYALPLQRSQETTVTTGPGLISEDMPVSPAETLPWGVNQIGAERAWEVTRGAGIKVAVIDTGIEHIHNDLAPNFAGGVSFVPGESFTDGNGHGTHVAGIIGARQNGSGIVGVAPNCSLYSVKALDRLGGGQYSWIISAIVWCVRNGMDVINMSLGGPDHVQALEDACNYALQHNVLVVAAAGNTGPQEDSVGYPARYGSVIAVSAVDTSRNLANFSSRGQHVDLTAPGVQILSTLPGNRYGRMNGTSMAAPHVAGTAALAISSHRFTPAETIREILTRTADNLGTPGRDDHFGFGLVDAEQAAFLRGMPTLH
jgi:subtilisin